MTITSSKVRVGLVRAKIALPCLISLVMTSNIYAATEAEPATSLPTVVLTLPNQGPVPFLGVVNFDNIGGKGAPMMYPVPAGAGLAGFLVGVVTHGALTSAGRSSADTATREKANEVLKPYKAALDKYNYPELMHASIEKIRILGDIKLLNPNETNANANTQITALPTFSLTQDQRALVLENVIEIRSKDKVPAYQNVVRVISPLKPGENLVEYWGNDEARNMKAEAARLYASSLIVALNDANASYVGAKEQKTIRYMEGEVEKMERGTLLKEECGQVLLRNLHGRLMYVPRKTSASDTANCTSVAQAATPVSSN